METQDFILPYVLQYATARELEAMTIASKIFAYQILPHTQLWKFMFIKRWEQYNYMLQDYENNPISIKLNGQLRNAFPSNWNENRIYQVLTHAITPIPAFADLQATRKSRYYSSKHHVKAISRCKVYPWRVNDFQFALNRTARNGDRCIRSNLPFDTNYRIAVFKVNAREYEIGLVASGYFEITIYNPPIPAAENEQSEDTRVPIIRTQRNEMIGIGLAKSSFQLIDRQPGWDIHSYGYHGDDGKFFQQNAHMQPSYQGERFGAPFGAGETVGCGVKRDLKKKQSSLFFTKNGQLISRSEISMNCAHEPLYPVVGVDSANIVHMNFGQQPFLYNDFLCDFMKECPSNYADVSECLSEQMFALPSYTMETFSSEKSKVTSFTDYDGEVTQTSVFAYVLHLVESLAGHRLGIYEGY